MVASVAAGPRISPVRLRAQNLKHIMNLAILGDLGFSKVKPPSRLGRRPKVLSLGAKSCSLRRIASAATKCRASREFDRKKHPDPFSGCCSVTCRLFDRSKISAPVMTGPSTPERSKRIKAARPRLCGYKDGKSRHADSQKRANPITFLRALSEASISPSLTLICDCCDGPPISVQIGRLPGIRSCPATGGVWVYRLRPAASRAGKRIRRNRNSAFTARNFGKQPTARVTLIDRNAVTMMRLTSGIKAPPRWAATHGADVLLPG